MTKPVKARQEGPRQNHNSFAVANGVGKVIQRKMTVGSRGDQYEQEADRVAEQVMATSGATTRQQPKANGNGIQHFSFDSATSQKPAWSGSEQANPILQSKASGLNRELEPSPWLEQQLNHTNGGGSPLPRSAKTFMEHRMGHDFSSVRVHTDSQSAKLSSEIQAKAFTTGKNIYFNQGQFSPETHSGKRLIAHELTHVVQQSGAAAGGTKQIQREETTEEKKGWLPELDEILPKQVGLLTHIYRVSVLTDIFGTKPLEEHVLLIHADAKAKKFSIAHGIGGIVALFDTRIGSQMDVSAAEKALATSKARYERSSLEKMKFVASQNAILTEKEQADLEKKLEAERKELLKLKEELKTTYDLADVADGDKAWTLDHLKQVADAFKFIPKGDKKALKGVVLKRVISLGGKTAGRFVSHQEVDDTEVTNEATLELANLAFKSGAPDSYGVIVHEVGHAVASLQQRTATDAEHQAVAKANKLVGVSNEAVEEFNAAVGEQNQAVEP
jgi:hypothetical protein